MNCKEQLKKNSLESDGLQKQKEQQRQLSDAIATLEKIISSLNFPQPDQVLPIFDELLCTLGQILATDWHGKQEKLANKQTNIAQSTNIREIKQKLNKMIENLESVLKSANIELPTAQQQNRTQINLQQQQKKQNQQQTQLEYALKQQQPHGLQLDENRQQQQSNEKFANRQQQHRNLQQVSVLTEDEFNELSATTGAICVVDVEELPTITVVPRPYYDAAKNVFSGSKTISKDKFVDIAIESSSNVQVKIVTYDADIRWYTRLYRKNTHLWKKLQRANGGVSYQCCLCKTSFTTFTVLCAHLNRHMDFKPYKCKFCSLRYHSYKPMRKHMKAKHPI